MELGKLRSGRAEFAVCIVGPLLVLGAIVIPGRLYCRHWDRNLAERRACLEQAPKLERQLAEAREALQPFAVAGAETDKPAELTLAVETAAQTFGFTTRSVNVAKQGEDRAWIDYRVAVNGGGLLKSVVGMLDFLERPSQRFRVGQVTLRASGFGLGATYDSDVILIARALTSVAASGTGGAGRPVTVAETASQATHLGQLVASVNAWLEEKRAPLIIPERAAPIQTAQAESSVQAIPFKLNGIARDQRTPLALTDRGVLGVGDTIDGYTLQVVAEDHVVVRGPDGRVETVRLYRDSVP